MCGFGALKFIAQSKSNNKTYLQEIEAQVDDLFHVWPQVIVGGNAMKHVQDQLAQQLCEKQSVRVLRGERTVRTKKKQAQNTPDKLARHSGKLFVH